MIYILIDIIFNTYLNLNSYLFILNIKENNLFNILLNGLFLDVFIFKSSFITLILLFIYIINKISHLKKMNNLILNILNLLLFCIVISFIYNPVNFYKIIILNIPIYILCYIISNEDIHFTRMIKYGTNRSNN